MSSPTPAPASTSSGSSQAATVTKHKDATSSSGNSNDAPNPPIRVLANPQAATASQIHPAVLLGLFALRFRALVADPVSAMSGSLPVVAAIQIAYAVMCLPPAGSSAAARQSRKLRSGEKKKVSAASSEGAEPNVAVTVVVALVISTAAAFALHALLILFGAPFLALVPHTLLCASHISLLGFFPLLYTSGVSGPAWLEILSARAGLDEVFGGLVGVTAGAWLGAVPIPLDWDREWQKWPVTILAGVYVGYALGKLVGGTVAFGKRFG
ncbi:GPI biosynthesis protein family Pig-F-domain-containing protein [Microdochium trichocladiopsis]|uniref:GPI biosynthesis protein family Pig-F-domain-containing protein n=1 Tax=Microdochium trichocladiopsis TaxID=1682393 RepID=A0A9P9BJT9_9PEZI|nr:GPI biosynthesis protein family Pig-F-domain-containing protein [Microdochium trichocladiopsis]KAH7025929.1 GPI biosynthesis protein family Pig-F-domain-containing protein [Microdochium trichocladiopsis]